MDYDRPSFESETPARKKCRVSKAPNKGGIHREVENGVSAEVNLESLSKRGASTTQSNALDRIVNTAPAASRKCSASPVATKKLKNKFPGKLHVLLANEEMGDIISWLPDGDAFVVKSREQFVKEALPRYFKEAKFESFTRKLNRWGFRRTNSDLYRNGFVYRHKLFKRDSPELSNGMSGKKEKDFFSRSPCPDSVHGRPADSQTDTHGIFPAESAGTQVTEPISETILMSSIQGSYNLPFQSGSTPLEGYFLEEHPLPMLTPRIRPVEYLAAEAFRVRALTSELELRNRALSALLSPMEAHVPMARPEELLRRRYQLGRLQSL